MTKTYADFGATYGAHADKTYGTLFDPDIPPTSGFVALLAQVTTREIGARIAASSRIDARPTTSSIYCTID